MENVGTDLTRNFIEYKKDEQKKRKKKRGRKTKENQGKPKETKEILRFC